MVNIVIFDTEYYYIFILKIIIINKLTPNLLKKCSKIDIRCILHPLNMILIKSKFYLKIYR
jgi:hypothetical protein